MLIVLFKVILDSKSRLPVSEFSGYHSIPRSFVCAGAMLDVDTCKGDGGGPLACKEPGTDNIYVQVRETQEEFDFFISNFKK